MRHSRSRKLLFEPLEAKCSPASLLLALAALGEQDQAAMEEYLDLRRAAHPDQSWQFQHDTEQLLRFVERHTGPAGLTNDSWNLPSDSQCAAADSLLRLEDHDVRMAVLSESIHLMQTNQS